MTPGLARGIILFGSRNNAALARRFHLDRHEDVNGHSGTGRVAEGVIFTDGKVALRWMTDTATTVIFDSINDVEAIHGHDGATEIVFDE